MPEDLRTALNSALGGVPVDRVAGAVERMIDTYRSGRPPSAPILAGRLDAVAYAAYRMPATYAAVAACLKAAAEALPGWEPSRLVDLGGGTGAAAWAVAARFPSLDAITVVDQAAEALDIGRSLAASASAPVLRNASWVRDTGFGAPLPDADLVTVSYLLGELPAAAQADVVDRASSLGGAVLLVEPGTPAGHARILAARARLIAAGLRVAAPCPHEKDCPVIAPDWCHFGARVNRSALHRRVKSASLGYEDEKFSYVLATPARTPSPTPAPPARECGRVLRRPAQRKGLVSLRLCRPDGSTADQIVTKRSGAEVYRAARDAEWGDPWGSAWASAGASPPADVTPQ